MTLKLKPGTKFAPTGLPFTDPRTGARFDGYERSIAGAVDMTIEHRRRNPKFYPVTETDKFDPDSVRQEYYRQLYQRRPDLFVVVPPTPTAVASSTSRQCTECGSTDIEEKLCPTCSGRRVTSRTCKSCGARLPL